MLQAALCALSPLVAQKFTKQENAKVFPVLQKEVGRGREHGPHAPSVFLQGICFLRSLSLSKLCVLLNRVLSFSLNPIRI